MTRETISAVDTAATHPKKISPAEWSEIVALTDVREAWGLDDGCTAESFESIVYGVKFEFVSGSPGYVGDLYILQGDTSEMPMRLLRKDGELIQLSND